MSNIGRYNHCSPLIARCIAYARSVDNLQQLMLEQLSHPGLYTLQVHFPEGVTEL